MKLPTIFYEQAVKSLRPNANWASKNGELIYHDNDCPADIEIEEKAKELQADYDAKKYQRDRVLQYPSITDVVVALAEKEEGDDTMWQEITALRQKVKSDNPKPS